MQTSYSDVELLSCLRARFFCSPVFAPSSTCLPPFPLPSPRHTIFFSSSARRPPSSRQILAIQSALHPLHVNLILFSPFASYPFPYWHSSFSLARLCWVGRMQIWSNWLPLKYASLQLQDFFRGSSWDSPPPHRYLNAWHPFSSRHSLRHPCCGKRDWTLFFCLQGYWRFQCLHKFAR